VLIEDQPATARGIAERVAQSDDAADITADDLFTRADLAMFSAKRDQFSGVRTFTDGMRLDATELLLSQHQTNSGRRDGIARIELRRAIDDDHLTLVYKRSSTCAPAPSPGSRHSSGVRTPSWAHWHPPTSCRWCASTD
jgi:hypothetical protein